MLRTLRIKYEIDGVIRVMREAMLSGTTHTTSREELWQLGLEDMAYIKAVTVSGQKVHAIFAADGTPLAIVPEREAAFAAVRQHELTPSSVH